MMASLHSFFKQKNCILRNQQMKGMTLLEMLVALGLFAFMFMFISQSLRQSHRQARKIKKDIQWKSSLSNVLNLMRQDLQGVSYFLDIHKSLEIQFYPKEGQTGHSEIASASFDLKTESSSQKSGFPVDLSPYFVFEGENNEIQFHSYSFSQSALNPSSSQWIKIHYYVEDCNHLDGKSSGSCLIRSARRDWDPREERKREEQMVLFRKLDSLKFSYSDTGQLSDEGWNEKWKIEHIRRDRNTSLIHPRQLPFPATVKMEIEQENRKQVYFFSVSQFHLRTWNPYLKNYKGFPKWTPPKEKNTNKEENQPVRISHPHSSGGYR